MPDRAQCVADSSDGTLTAVMFIAAIWTVRKAVAVEPPDDAVATIGTWKESRGALGPHPGCTDRE